MTQGCVVPVGLETGKVVEVGGRGRQDWRSGKAQENEDGQQERNAAQV
jgi:hypothetical protein